MTTKNELFEIIRLYCLECCSGNESQIKECDAHVLLPLKVTGVLSGVLD
jgi:hypothetical protein